MVVDNDDNYSVPPTFRTTPLEVLFKRTDLSITRLTPDTPGAHLPLVGSLVEAGFPSPADDWIEQYLSLDEMLIVDQASTYFVRVKGRSMERDNIFPGDILVVDRGRRPQSENVVVAVLDGELTVKTLSINDSNGAVSLVPANAAFPVITLQEGNELSVWGVVTYSIHCHLRS